MLPESFWWAKRQQNFRQRERTIGFTYTTSRWSPNDILRHCATRYAQQVGTRGDCLRRLSKVVLNSVSTSNFFLLHACCIGDILAGFLKTETCWLALYIPTLNLPPPPFAVARGVGLMQATIFMHLSVTMRNNKFIAVIYVPCRVSDRSSPFQTLHLRFSR